MDDQGEALYTEAITRFLTVYRYLRRYGRQLIWAIWPPSTTSSSMPRTWTSFPP